MVIRAPDCQRGLGTAALLELADANLEIVDVFLQEIDVFVVEALVPGLIARDLAHELAQAEQALLDAIQPVICAVQAFAQ